MTTARRYTEQARSAARILARAGTERRDAALAAVAAAVRADRDEILRAAEADVRDARAAGQTDALIDRLALDPRRLEGIARAVDEVRALPDPLGEVVDEWTRPNGLSVQQVRIPLGVILMIYEARPNVTVDAAALCLKSGNAAILRGGKEALRTNRALAAAVARGLSAAGLPAHAVQLVDDPDRELLLALLREEGRIDLAIPRGGEGLIRFVAEHARVPVIQHYRGVCHLYVDAAADKAKAIALAVNGKSRPATCNATECLLVHEAAAALLPEIGRALVAAGVELRAEPRAAAALHDVPHRKAEPDDFGREFLDRILAVKVVSSFEDAVIHVAELGSGHTEAIVTEDAAAAERWLREVDSSCVLVNASTRFNDGGELGLGAEIGISTTRLHAYGPMGLRELTARKFVVRGSGQVRA